MRNKSFKSMFSWKPRNMQIAIIVWIYAPKESFIHFNIPEPIWKCVQTIHYRLRYVDCAHELFMFVECSIDHSFQSFFILFSFLIPISTEKIKIKIKRNKTTISSIDYTWPIADVVVVVVVSGGGSWGFWSLLF